MELESQMGPREIDAYAQSCVDHVDEHDTAEGRAAVYYITRSLASFCLRNNTKQVVVLDKSARYMGTALSTFWDVMLDSQEQPSIHFLDPAQMRASYKEQFRSPRVLRSRAKAVEAELTAAEHPLLERKDQETVITDVCSHSGQTLHHTKKVLGHLGFTQLKTAAATETGLLRWRKADINLSGQPFLCCNLFGNDPALYSSGSIFANRLEDYEPLDKAAARSERYVVDAIHEGAERDIHRLFMRRILDMPGTNRATGQD